MNRERVVVLSSMIPTFSHLGSIVLGTLSFGAGLRLAGKWGRPMARFPAALGMLGAAMAFLAVFALW